MISQMSGKLKGINAINSSPLNNPFCLKMSQVKGSVCGSCYSIKMLSTYRKNCDPVFRDRGDRLSQGVLSQRDLPKINDRYFRFSAHGELINDRHLMNYMRIADHNPQTTFALYTKRVDIVHRYLDLYELPSNVILIYSSPILNKEAKLPKEFHKVFTVYDEGVSDNINCGSKSCLNCLLCYKKDTVSVINERVK